MKQGLRGYPWRYGAFSVAFYSSVAIYQGYLSKYFASLGISGFPLMILIAAMPLAALFSQPLWGQVSDRSRSRASVVAFLSLISALIGLLFLLNRSYLWVLLMYTLYGAFYTSIQPLGDSLILEGLAQTGAPFGPARLMGSWSFALTNLLIAGLFEGRYRLVPLVLSFFCLLNLLTSRGLPRLPGHQHGLRKVPLKQLLELPQMKPLLALMTLLMLAMGYYYGYFTLFLTGIEGGGAAVTGLAYFLSAASEAPFLFYSDRLFERYGAGKLLVFSSLMLSLRFLILGFSRNLGLILLSQLFHGGGFIVITVAMAQYMARVAPETLKSGGQTLLSMGSYSLARVFGTLFGGVVSVVSGNLALGFRAMALLCLICLPLFAPRFLRIPAVNGKNYQ